MYDILLVDDEKLTLDYLSVSIPIQDTDWSISNVCCDAISALEWLNENNVDLVITDIKMPEMSGLELCQAILKKNPQQKIIILSGYDEFQFAQQAIKYGVKDYLLKPISLTNLKETLDTIKIILNAEQTEEYMYNSLLSSDDIIPEGNIVDKAKQYIHLHYAKPISLALIAEEIGVSPNYLSTLFHNEVGKSYIKYLTRIRMENAINYMKSNPTIKIYEIAEKVGYVNVKHFSFVFKQYFSISPGEYQQKNQYR